MEVITLLIRRVTEEGLLAPIGNATPTQRISIYADDVVLFVKPEVQDLVAVREALLLFGRASGLFINYNKTSATLIRAGQQDTERVAQILNCPITEFPIRYLGLQLALKPLTKNQWQPMLDAAIRVVPAWLRGLIGRPGRLVLVKSVLSARAVHHLIVTEAPAWLFEEFGKYLWSFFWAGKDHVNGGRCLVAWDRVCRPLEYGGLGIKNLRLQGLALRVRWQWLLRTDEQRPWQGLQMLKDTPAREVFDSLVRIRAGNGQKTFFWKDRWINNRSVKEVAPGLFSLVSTRVKNSRTVAQGLLGNAWVADITETLAYRGARECL